MTGPESPVRRIVEALGLAPHSEGGFFREIFRDPAIVPGNRPDTGRNASTTILFLVPPDGRSRLHRLESDETWHYNLGGAMAVMELVKGMPPRRTMIGPGLPAYTVKAGTWFGALPEPGAKFSLVTCTVSPGFDFGDFRMADRLELAGLFPQAADLLDKLA